MFEELRIYGKCRHVIGNILNSKQLEETFNEFQPEIVFHLAVQPLVKIKQYYY